jgi:DNA-binding LacI/PurR family transcriptional regulator
MSLNTARERQEGYGQAYSDAGLPIPEVLIRYGDFRQAGGYYAMQGLSAHSPAPTAVFAPAVL